MANIRVKDLPNTDTLVDGDELIVDSSSAGTRRISFGELKSETASDFVAAPSTYKVATLAADNKLDPSQIPDTLTNGLNFVGVANSAPDLASTTQGDFYVIGTAFGVYSVGDQAVYDGSAYVRVTDGTKQIGEGGTGATTAAGARTNLEVNSKDEDAQANALKTTAPALYFDGSSSDITVAADPKFAFTDGTNDLPFTVEGWVKADSVGNTFLFGLHEAASTKRQFACYISATNKLRMELIDSTGDACYNDTDTTLSAYDGQWLHVASVYTGADASTFGTTAPDNVTHYVNGSAVASTGFPNVNYGGMSDTGAVGYIGRFSNTRGQQHVRSVRVYNRALSADEVAELARGNDLGFSEEWGGANGGVYTSNFTSTTDSWGFSNTSISQASGPIDAKSNLLQITTSAGSSIHYVYRNVGATVGKRYRIKFSYYIPSGQSNVNGIKARWNNSSEYSALGSTLDAWDTIEFEAVSTDATVEIYQFDDGVQVFDDVGGDDITYITDITITEIGTLADFRSERYDTSTNKLYDNSDNAFVGTGTSVTLTGREQPVYETGTWTPSISFGGGSVGLSASSASGFYTRIGNQCIVRGAINLSLKGSSNGAAKITGLPFTSVGGTSMGSMLLGLTANMAGLTSVPTGQVAANDTTIDLYDWGATGTSPLDESNFTDNTYLRFSVTYQIQ